MGHLAAAGVGLYIVNNRGLFIYVWHSLMCFGLTLQFPQLHFNWSVVALADRNHPACIPGFTSFHLQHILILIDYIFLFQYVNVFFDTFDEQIFVICNKICFMYLYPFLAVVKNPGALKL